MFELLIKIICMMTLSIINTKLPTKPITQKVAKAILKAFFFIINSLFLYLYYILAPMNAIEVLVLEV